MLQYLLFFLYDYKENTVFFQVQCQMGENTKFYRLLLRSQLPTWYQLHSQKTNVFRDSSWDYLQKAWDRDFVFKIET